MSPEKIENTARVLYTAYREEAFDGDPLPCWGELSSDLSKSKQVQGWRKVAAITLQSCRETGRRVLEHVKSAAESVMIE